MWVINTVIMEKRSILLLSLSTWHRVFKFGCYNCLDISRSALWESDENGLYFDGNIKDGGIG